MLFKYYTADLVVQDGDKLVAPFITIQTWFWQDLVQAVIMMQNRLAVDGLSNHLVYNLRRIK